MRTSTTTSAIADSVGALLKQARTESGLSRSAVALRSKIPERYIALFEEDTAGPMPEDVYVKIYLKAYGKFLGFEATTLLDLYKKEKARYAPPVETTTTRRTTTRSSSPTRRHPSKSVPNSALYVTPKLIQNALLGLALLGFGLYFGLQIKKLVAPPSIALLSPADGLVTQDRTLMVEGRTEAEVTVRINGKQVSPDADGKFKDTLDLQEGLNLITITGSKKHSKNMTVTRRIIVMPKERAAMPEAPVDAVDATAAAAAAEAAEAAAVAPKPAPKPAAPAAVAPAPVTEPAANDTPVSAAPTPIEDPWAPTPEPEVAGTQDTAPAAETTPTETQPQTEPAL